MKLQNYLKSLVFQSISQFSKPISHDKNLDFNRGFRKKSKFLNIQDCGTDIK